MKRRLITVLMAAVLFGGSLGGAALAMHGPAPIVSPHVHLINGQRVGPNACEDGPSLAFDHFHLNVHTGQPGLGKLGRVDFAPCPST